MPAAGGGGGDAVVGGTVCKSVVNRLNKEGDWR